MGYLILGLTIGIVADRYILPILDMLLEIISNKVNEIITDIQINTNLKSLEFQNAIGQDQLSPVVGFHTEMQEDEYYEEDDDEENKKIGFFK